MGSETARGKEKNSYIYIYISLHLYAYLCTIIDVARHTASDDILLDERKLCFLFLLDDTKRTSKGMFAKKSYIHEEDEYTQRELWRVLL